MLHTAEVATCPILNEPNNRHLRMVCEDCDIRFWLVRATLGRVEEWYHEGYVDQDQFEAYMFVWVTGAPRFADYSGWTDPPTLPDVRRIVRKLLRAAGRPVPGALVDCLPARYVVVAGGHVIDLDADETLPGDDTEQFEPGYLSS